MVTLETGSIFAGRYEVVRRLGAGGMGAVYLACDPQDRSFKVALKVLYPGAIQSSNARERFRNEITASYRIKHPNVVRAYEYFDAEDVQAYAMEYIEGGDLLERIREGRMAPAEACSILLQLASALEAIHKAGIIHRDLKPENILLTRSGTIKITDFGVARLRDSRTLTNAGAMVGTPKYLAPEYVETGDCDGRGDIFAVGVIGYELVAGISPFGKDFKPKDVLDRLKMRIPPLSEVAPSCPADLARIIHKAMSLRVNDRYQSATAFHEDLRRFQSGEPLEAPVQVRPSLEAAPAELDTAPSAEEWESLAHADDSDAAVPSGGFFVPSEHSASAHRPRMHAVPVLVVTFTFCFLLGALGFASVVFMRTRNPLRELTPGLYHGAIAPHKPGEQPIPLGIWSFGDHSLLIVGKRGCAADLFSARGEYRCGTDTYRFSVGPTDPKKAVGLVQINNAPSRAWRVARFSGLDGPETIGTAVQEHGTPSLPPQAIIPAAPERPGGPASAAPGAKTPAGGSGYLSTIEARLRSGELSAEAAARLLLEESGTKGNGDK